eukprot:gene17089-18810_t
MAENAEVQSVLEYWFKPGKDLDGYLQLWFEGGEAVDQELKEQFSTLIEKARNQELKSWEENSKSALAHIILIDQFCRSVYRGTPKAFDCDHISLAIAKKLVAAKTINYKDLNFMERFFAYLPFEHSENMDDQNESCRLFAELVKDSDGTEFNKLSQIGLSCSQKHREVIKKFGRFPKRNLALGRKNTPEEEEFLNNNSYVF